jgi:hypothetical protein
MRNDLDEILDSGLATYLPREPWPGIEERVIARVARAKRSGSWFRWAIPVPVLAGGLAILLRLAGPEAPRVAVQPPAAASVVHAVRNVQPPASAAARPARRLSAPAKGHDIARLTVFPSPSVLNEQERALVQLAVSNPEVLRDAIRSWEERNQPLTVEPISIPPLENGNSMEE